MLTAHAGDVTAADVLQTWGTIAAIALAALVGSGQIAGWVASLLGMRRNARKAGESDGKAEATTAAAIDRLAEANGRIADSLEALQKWSREHELSDTRWQTELSAAHRQAVETQAAIARTLDGVQRQLTNMALGLAPEGAAREIPPNMRRPSRR